MVGELNQRYSRIEIALGLLVSATNEAHLHRVESGSTEWIGVREGETLQSIAVSATTLAVTSYSGSCFIWKLPNPSPSHPMVAQSAPGATTLTISGRVLAILSKPNDDEQIEFELINFDRDCPQSLKFSP